MASSTPQITMPRPPQPAARARFPYLASIAPVLVSVAIWLITQSLFALLFAALGPVVALGSLLDSRLQARRTGKAEAARFDAELDATEKSLRAAHESERAVLLRAHPSPAALLGAAHVSAAPGEGTRKETQRGMVADEAFGRSLLSEAWRAHPRDGVRVRLGLGVMESGLELRGEPGGEGGAAADPRSDSLRESAERLSDSPILLGAELGLGLCGIPAQTEATARSLVLQLAAKLRPDRYGIQLSGRQSHAEWLEELPHPLEIRKNAAGPCSVLFLPLAPQPADRDSGEYLVLSDPDPRMLGSCRAVVAFGAEAAIVRHPEPIRPGSLRPDYLTIEQAVGVARLLRAEAHRRGFLASTAALPDRLELGSILPLAGQKRSAEGALSDGLPAEVLASTDGLVALDLVRHGPHAIVGGTTGSGKSEFLISWVLAMAAATPPESLSVLLVDFKGGATFGGLADLPHCVGVITDLDEHGALRALESLSAELAHRERRLAALGARSIEEIPRDSALPRLLIVVDEFAAMVAGFPELHGLFADIASRGRSLGVHLILCTQRPAGVVRDAVLANSGLRLSLRVNNAGDSTAVVGTDLASRLPALPAGRAALSIAGEPPRLVQVAIAAETDMEHVRSLWAVPVEPLRRPWCEPLPEMLTGDELMAAGGGAADPMGSIVFGLSDLPREQRQTIARFDPANHGHMLVLGGHRSGKSTVLDTLATGAASYTRIGADAELLWDAVCEWAAALDEARDVPVTGRHLLLIDDVDATISQLTDDHRATVLDLLGRIAREGAARGIHLVLSAQRLGGALQSLAPLLEARLMLRLPSKHDHLLASGAGESFDATAPAGRGSWLGHTVQVAVTSGAAGDMGETPRVRGVGLEPGCTLAVVAVHPASWLRRFAEAGYGQAAAGQPGIEQSSPDPAEAQPPAVLMLAEIPTLDAEAFAVRSGGRRTIILGDVEAWQAHWTALAAVRGRIPLIFDGCSVADFRSITRRRELPPPLHRAGGSWLLAPDGAVVRVKMAPSI